MSTTTYNRITPDEVKASYAKRNIHPIKNDFYTEQTVIDRTNRTTCTEHCACPATACYLERKDLQPDNSCYRLEDSSISYELELPHAYVVGFTLAVDDGEWLGYTIAEKKSHNLCLPNQDQLAQHNIDFKFGWEDGIACAQAVELHKPRKKE